MKLDVETLWPCGPKTPIWPEGRIPDFQPNQIAATTDEAAAPGFDPATARWPHIQWYPEPDPAVATDALAVIISGGGYDCCCDLPAYRPLVAELLLSGIHCVNFTYRTPRPKDLPIYQTAWEDGRRAMRVIRREAIRRGLDPRKTGAMSCSAGSHLALLLGLSSHSPELHPPVDALDEEPQPPLAWLLAMCPAYVLSDGTTGPNENGGEGASVDPIFKIDDAACPVCFLHGSADPYSPLASTQLWRRLREKDVHVELHLDAGRGHGPVGPGPFREHAIGFLHRIGILPPAADQRPTTPPPPYAEALAEVEAWEAARRAGAPIDLHLS